MLRFYTKEKISKEVHTINLSRAEAELILGGDLFKDCPQYNAENTVIIERDTEMAYPTWDNNELREMTREEEILILNLTEKLIDGEYIQDGRVVKIEYDTNLGYLKPTWDKGEHVWYEGTTHDEFVKMRADKILEHSQLEENKKALENSKFTTQDEIQLITKKMQILEKEINDIADKVKTL